MKEAMTAEKFLAEVERICSTAQKQLDGAYTVESDAACALILLKNLCELLSHFKT